MSKYFDTKPGSLEEAVSAAQQAAIAISKKERGEKPKNEKDEGNAFTGALMAAKEKGEKTFTVGGKTYDVKTEEDKLDPVNPKAVKKKFDDRKDKDIDNDGDVDSTDKYLHKRRKAISKAIAKDNNEAYDIGKDYAEHTLDVTPGQGKKDVDNMLNSAYNKNQSMREALAKVWGVSEGKSPFQKEEEKPLTKTMTGQKPTTVKVNPKIEEK